MGGNNEVTTLILSKFLQNPKPSNMQLDVHCLILLKMENQRPGKKFVSDILF